MKPCRNCDFYNTNDRTRCFKCKAILDHDELTTVKKARRRLEFDSVLTRWLSNGFYAVIKFHSSALPTDVTHRNPWIAGWLFLIPGAGQVYNHQYKKAALFIVYFVILFTASILTVTRFYSNFVMYALMGHLFLIFADGVTSAIRINGTGWRKRNALATYSYLLFMFGMFLIILPYLFLPALKLVTIRQDSLAPFFRTFDRVFVDRMTYRFRKPRRGEIVYYDPKSYDLIVPGGEFYEDITYVINMANNFERVVGLPGETVVLDTRQFFVNGEKLDERFYPLKTDKLLNHMRFEIPEDHYLVMITYSPQETLFKFVGPNKAPDLHREGLQFNDSFAEACLVHESEIIGRAICLYNPPTRRTWLFNDYRRDE